MQREGERTHNSGRLCKKKKINKIKSLTQKAPGERTLEQTLYARSGSEKKKNKDSITTCRRTETQKKKTKLQRRREKSTNPF